MTFKNHIRPGCKGIIGVLNQFKDRDNVVRDKVFAQRSKDARMNAKPNIVVGPSWVSDLGQSSSRQATWDRVSELKQTQRARSPASQ
jgi:hypothetical protein